MPSAHLTARPLANPADIVAGQRLRIVMFGSPPMAVNVLDALSDAGHEVVAAVTQPDRRRGRGKTLTSTALGVAARDAGIPVLHDAAGAAAVPADLGVVVAFGQLLRRPLLEQLPTVNLHYSLLPRWRGAASIERAILAGDTETGVCVMRVTEGLDTGPVYARHVTEIGATTTADDLRSELTSRGASVLVELLDGRLPEAVEQAGESTYAHKLTSDDGRAVWGDDTMVDRQVRAGIAWTMFRGRRLKLISGELRDGRFAPVLVQPEGRPQMAFDAWCRGLHAHPDDICDELHAQRRSS